MPAKLLLLFLFGFVPIVFLIKGLKSLWISLKKIFFRGYIKTFGYVVTIKSVAPNDISHRVPIAEFEVQGTKYRCVGKNDLMFTPRLGKPIPLYYNPSNPTECFLKREIYFTFPFILFGVLFLSVLIIWLCFPDIISHIIYR